MLLSNPLLLFWKSTPYPYPYPVQIIIVAIPVCPRSVSCHPMGSMSFKALQSQPLPHCCSHDRSLSRETASSSSKTARRRTTGPTQVGQVIHFNLKSYLPSYCFLSQTWQMSMWFCACLTCVYSTDFPSVHLSAAVSKLIGSFGHHVLYFIFHTVERQA